MKGAVENYLGSWGETGQIPDGWETPPPSVLPDTDMDSDTDSSLSGVSAVKSSPLYSYLAAPTIHLMSGSLLVGPSYHLNRVLQGLSRHVLGLLSFCVLACAAGSHINLLFNWMRPY